MRVLADFRNPPPLTHLKRLTTKDGIVQHADLEVPDPAHGYSLDDNARAVIAVLNFHQLFNDFSTLRLAEIYLNYVRKVEKMGGSFHNFLSFTEQILDSEGSEDSVGRAVWALGEVIRCNPSDNLTESAQVMFSRARIHHHLEHAHLRTKAYILLGLIAAGDLNESKLWSSKLSEFYQKNKRDNWLWFEDSLRYANGVLPYSLTCSSIALRDNDLLGIAEESFIWLDKVSRIDGKPAPIGQDGWYYRGGKRAVYDQQPIDAAKMVLAATALYEATKKEKYLSTALEWINWYYGFNIQGVSLICGTTGGVYDAITPSGVNKNQGAESIVTYLLAYLSLSRLAKRNNGD